MIVLVAVMAESIAALSSRSEMALFRNLCVELRIGLCDVPEYVSAQILALLDLAKNDSFLNRERAAPAQRTSTRF